MLKSLSMFRLMFRICVFSVERRHWRNFTLQSVNLFLLSYWVSKGVLLWISNLYFIGYGSFVWQMWPIRSWLIVIAVIINRCFCPCYRIPFRLATNSDVFYSEGESLSRTEGWCHCRVWWHNSLCDTRRHWLSAWLQYISLRNEFFQLLTRLWAGVLRI